MYTDVKHAFDQHNFGAIETFFYDAYFNGVDIHRLVSDFVGNRFNIRLTDAFTAAAGLASEPNTNEFHNNAHFAHVFAMSYMLGDEAVKRGIIREDQLPLLLIAALIHDYGHDGKKNIVDGTHIPYRLEMQSFNLAKDRLKSAGLTDQELEIVKALILTTDVTGDAPSPAASVKRYKESVLAGNPDPSLLKPELQILAQDNWYEVALMLHEADIGIGCAISTAYTKFNGKNINDEWKTEHTAEGDIGFFKFVVEQKMFSETGAALLQNNFDQVMRDYGLDV